MQDLAHLSGESIECFIYCLQTRNCFSQVLVKGCLCDLERHVCRGRSVRFKTLTHIVKVFGLTSGHRDT